MKNKNWSKTHKESYNSNRKPAYVKQDRPIITGTKVEVRNDDVNGALRRLKKILERDNRQKDLAKHEFYEKPSLKRKRLSQAAKSRWSREVEQQRRNGDWNDCLNANDSSYLKTKKKRRKHTELQKKIKSRQSRR